MSSVLLFLAGAIAGFIDSIAGGGGLITVPSLTLVLGPGPEAIGTNKIAGVMSAATALLIYSRGGHVLWKRSAAFTIWITLGSFLGSQVAPLLPLSAFRYFLILSCPLILYIVWRKDLWVSREAPHENSDGNPKPDSGAFSPALIASGLAVGFYDGVWGPGGGTFMFLALFFIAKQPLLSAIAAAKLANTFSAGSALLGYAIGGHVHWGAGVAISCGVTAGAFFGARHATKNAAKVVRPVLALVVLLLMIKILSA